MKDGVRIAVVGTGAIAQLTHIPVLSKLRGASLVALCDNDGAKARALADRFGVPDVFTDFEELLDSDELDAVVIATPNHLHEPHVLSALRQKLHVLCERPLALSPRGVERCLAAAQRAERVLAVGHNHRFRTDVQALDQFIRNSELGQVTSIRAGSLQVRRNADGWRNRRAESGGGVFLEQGFPLLDLALWLADQPAPVRVSANMRRGRGAGAVEDTMQVFLECENGLVFIMDLSWSHVGDEDRWWFEVHATRGSARLSPLRVTKELNGRAVDVSPSGAASRESPFLQSYRAEIAHFLAMIRGEVAYEPPAEQVMVQRIVDAVYKAADDGKEIRF
ncbi:MAG TPA: gfo/Idh/MocA family oxidoreductase [Gemmatimonas aurantiaca]|uniref:Gfo/Idh/MocA family oxidoreductase n=2 Tax=Gemmatimonas aurantiaca TaxID=173480 RepID=A0A3D4V779_9BACT|nr:Gfo/Idh/MocA family oxidoreductase [Gemmatimonas aurantiaca]BAH38219.1 putative oxidoreductase [Gemmatimonas aurantiaca T-27]HCT56993.1 gfo/Idh/MocA family oxidoreductase [Gemmatimonas aurantiaca]